VLKEDRKLDCRDEASATTTTTNPVGGLPDASTEGTYRSTGFPEIVLGRNRRSSLIFFLEKLHTAAARVTLALD
jgi:hypothetical protein